jgi:hypothetical protein
MANLGNFDATQVAPNEPFEVIPGGKYPVQIVQSEMRPTKDGGGQYLWLEEEIIDGEYKGRKLWDRLNLTNNNAHAVEIAQRTLSAICHAVGQLHVTDSEALHFKPMIATVRVKPAKGDYDASNEIRGYEPMGGAAPVTVTPGAKPHVVKNPVAPPSMPKTAAATPPWKRGKPAA